MKKGNKKFISFITTIALTTTMIINSTVIITSAKDSDEEKLKAAVEDKFDSYLEENSKKVKEEKFQTQEIDEDEETRVIVQLDEKPAIDVQSNKYTKDVQAEENQVKDKQSDVIEKVQEITGTSVKKSFGYLVNGFSIETKRKNIPELQSLEGVKSVTEVKGYKPDMAFATKITEAASTWKDYGYKGQGMVVSIIDSGIDSSHKDLQNIDTAKMKLNKSDVEKKINDDLGHGQYYTDKVPYGYNYADDNSEIRDTTGIEHGMHVAGIVAANGNDENVDSLEAVRGVAPEAQLLAMKVIGNNPNLGSAFTDDIISAIEDSVKLGADVINMSLGAAFSYAEDDGPEEVAVQKAIDAGTLFVTSAGNSQTSTTSNGWNQPENNLGLTDDSALGTPVAKNGLTVASSENSTRIFDKVHYESEDQKTKKDIKVYNIHNMSIKDLSDDTEVVDCGKGSKEDFDNKDLSGKVALIIRGGLTFQEKYDNAEAAGAKAVILYNNNEAKPDEIIECSVKVRDIPLLSLGYKDGVELKNSISEGYRTYKFKSTKGNTDNEDEGDMSQYSSWGPTPNLDFKPEITAPGGDIYSLANNNSYQYMSGTSMSSPHVAGGEALILQSLKDRKLDLSTEELMKYLKNTTMNTAKPMIDKYDETKSIPYSPRRQGAGLMQIEDAIRNKVIITGENGIGGIALKEVGNKKEFTLQLKNFGDKDITYDLSKEKVYSEVVDKDNKIHEVVLDNSWVNFDKDKVQVKSNSTATVTATLNIDSSIDLQRFVEGFIKFESEDENEPSLSVPFMGYYGDWAKEKNIDEPNYKDSDKSLLGLTGLGENKGNNFVFYGTEMVNDAMRINKEKVGFSPNDDGNKDTVTPQAYLLRNVKTMKVQVVDSQGEVVRNLYESHDCTKNGTEKLSKTILNEAKWDGTVYNTSNGEFEKVDDGQYAIRINTSSVYNDNKEQNLDLPVKVDTKAPEVSIKGVTKYIDKDGQAHYKLSWSAKDEDGTGLADIYAISVNGNVYLPKESDITAVNGEFSTDIYINEGEVNDISVGTVDNAGNFGVATRQEKVGKLKNLVFSGLSDNMLISKDDLVNGKFEVKGTASDEIANFKINNKEIKVEYNYFNDPIELSEGKNIVNIYAEDKSGKVVVDDNITVILDTKAPEVKVTPDIGEEAPYYSTNNNTIDFSVFAEDENGIENAVIESSNAVTPLKIDSDGNAKASLELVDGLNKIILVVIDKAKNTYKKEMIVLKGNPTADFTFQIDNLDQYTFLNKTNTNSDVFTIKGHVNNKTAKTFKINKEDVKINDDLSFSHNVKLKQGDNRISIEALDAKGNTVVRYAYRIIYDSINPKLSLQIPEAREDNVIYTNKDQFDIKGSVTDNFDGYTLYVNGNVILSLEKDPTLDEDLLKRTFDTKVKLKEGINNISVKVSDALGNAVNNNIKVVFDNEVPNKPNISKDTNGVENGKAKVTIDTDEKQIDKIEYSFDGKNYMIYTGELTVEKTTDVYARVTDYAGNVSEVTKTNVYVDNEAPKVTVSGVIDGQKYYEPVTPVINVDDKEAKVTSLLNGKEYNGEKIDTEGNYELEVYAVDKTGNKSNVIKKNFVLERNEVENIKDGKSVISFNGIKAAEGKTTIFNSSNDFLEAIIEDVSNDTAISSPNLIVNIPKEILQLAGDGQKVKYNQNIYEDTDLLSGLKSIGSIFELTLRDDEKEINEFGDSNVEVQVKLSEEQLKALDTSKLSAYYYDEVEKNWKSIGGEFINDKKIFKFNADHFTKFTIAELKDEDNKTNNNSSSNINNSNVNPKVNKSNNHSKANATRDSNTMESDVVLAVLILGSIVVMVASIKRKKLI